MAKATPVVITIDGPAGAGKSTVAKAVARALGFSYLDTGAMYRALTLKAMRSGCPLDDEEALVRLAGQTSIQLLPDPQTGTVVRLDGEDVSADIRTVEVTNQTFYIARAPRVREIMVDRQRQIGREQDVVVEGRDIGTVVFPQARYKFYLDANFEERARRRLTELQEKGKTVEAEQLKAELQERDQRDLTRPAGPLKQAADAVVIDSTSLTIDGVVQEILRNIDGPPAS